jgi:hypothetical protein
VETKNESKQKLRKRSFHQEFIAKPPELTRNT